MSRLGRPAKPLGTAGNIRFKVNSNRTVTAKVDFMDADGVSRTIERTRPRQADASDAIRIAVSQRVATRTTHSGITARTTVGVLVELYLEDLERNPKLRVQTKARYAQTAKLIANAWSHVAVGQLTSGTTAKFILSLSRDHLAEARMVKTVLRAVLRAAVLADAVGDEVLSMNAAVLSVPIRNPRALRADEMERLRELIHVWRRGARNGPHPTMDLADVLEIQLSTGARVGEVLALRHEDVRVDDDGVVFVNLTGTIVYGSQLGSHRQPSTKKGGIATNVRLTKAAALAVLSRMENVGHEFLFCTRNGTPLQQQNLARQLRAIVAGTEFEWVTTHVMRKTSGTAVFRAAGIAAASKHLRHSTERVTATTYIDKPTDAEDTTEALAAYEPSKERPRHT